MSQIPKKKPGGGKHPATVDPAIDASREKLLAEGDKLEVAKRDWDVATSLFPSDREDDEILTLELNWFTTPREVSFELLVSTALAMRSHSKSDSHAADAALRLIDTCARLLAQNRLKNEREQAIETEIKKLGLGDGGKSHIVMGSK